MTLRTMLARVQALERATGDVHTAATLRARAELIRACLRGEIEALPEGHAFAGPIVADAAFLLEKIRA